MTQIGEMVSPPEFISDEEHSESTCPWHEKADPAGDPMEAQAPDEDSSAMPANLGTKLGRNIEDSPPSAKTLRIPFRKDQVFTYGKGKVVQTYEKYVEHEFPLQYAPHHLIPGNESLKGSPIVAYLGDDGVIDIYKKGIASKIRKGSVGYDVNRGRNGVWLPSPYALSNANEWPAQAGIAALVRRQGGPVLIDLIEQFKAAYVAASIHESGQRQFHMRHNDYSRKVTEILEAIANKLAFVAQHCPLVPATDKKSDKYDPPYGLVGRLDALSANLERLLKGPVWRPPLFTDSLTETYASTLPAILTKGQIDKIL
jgi:hypothetical protein